MSDALLQKVDTGDGRRVYAVQQSDVVADPDAQIDRAEYVLEGSRSLRINEGVAHASTTKEFGG